MTLELAPGSSVTEGTLIDRVGLGRTPVREAIQRLAWEGLMEIQPRVGIRIAPLDTGRLAARTQRAARCRDLLARSAARLITREFADSFRAALVAMHDAVFARNVIRFLEADKSLDDRWQR